MCEWLSNLFKKKVPPPALSPVGNLKIEEWELLYGISNFNKNGILHANPSVIANKPDITSAVLLIHKMARLSDFHVRVVGTTTRQLRVGNPPNPWECFWLFTNYTPGANLTKTCNYIAVKPNGVEVGNASESVAQTILATVAIPQALTPIGKEFTLDVAKQGMSLVILLNSVPVFGHTFDGSPVSVDNPKPSWIFNEAGSFGLYAEDSMIEVKEFTIL